MQDLSHHFRLYYTSSSFQAAKRSNVHPEHFEINWGIAGINRYLIRGKTHTLGPAGLLLIAPNQEHRYDSDRPYEICSILFTRSFLRKTLIEECFAMDLLDGAHPAQCLDFSSPAYARIRLDAFFRRLRSEKRDGPASWLRVHQGLSELLLFLDEEKRRTARPKARTDALDLVLADIHGNFFEPLDLRQLASRYRIPYTSLSMRFVRRTGKTFTAFLKELRLSRSAELLREEGQSVTTAAFESGFEDLSNFHRVFKAFYGVTPMDYRQGRTRGRRPE